MKRDWWHGNSFLGIKILWAASGLFSPICFVSSVFSVVHLEAARGEQWGWHWCVPVAAAGVAASLWPQWSFLLIAGAFWAIWLDFWWLGCNLSSPDRRISVLDWLNTHEVSRWAALNLGNSLIHWCFNSVISRSESLFATQGLQLPKAIDYRWCLGLLRISA